MGAHYGAGGHVARCPWGLRARQGGAEARRGAARTALAPGAAGGREAPPPGVKIIHTWGERRVGRRTIEKSLRGRARRGLGGVHLAIPAAWARVWGHTVRRGGGAWAGSGW